MKANLIQGLQRAVQPLLRQTIPYALQALPRKTRLRHIRKKLQLAPEPPAGLIFKIAETQDELAQAFTLLHDAYVSMKLMTPHPSGMRVTKYHALPSTTTLIAVQDGKVQATISLVRSNPFGLPCEQLYDIDFLKKQHARIAEVSALAVDKKFSRQHGALLWPLISFMYQYATRFFGLDYLVIVVHPKWLEFYEATMLFQPLKKRRIGSYDFVNGAPAVGGFLNLKQFPILAEQRYNTEPAPRNLFRYLCEHSFRAFYFPTREYASVSDPVMTPQLLHYFFTEATQNFRDFTPEQIHWLHTLYSRETYARILPPLSLQHVASHQQSKRFEVHCEGELFTPGAARASVLIKAVSLEEITAVMHRKVASGEEYNLEIAISRRELVNVTVVLTWHDDDGACGFAIAHAPQNWATIIQALEQTKCVQMEPNHSLQLGGF